MNQNADERIAPFMPGIRASARPEQELRDELCMLRMQVKALRSQLDESLPWVDQVEVTGDNDPRRHVFVTPDEDIREQIRAELFDDNEQWIEERALELVKAERQEIDDQADAYAHADEDWS